VKEIDVLDYTGVGKFWQFLTSQQQQREASSLAWSMYASSAAQHRAIVGNC